MVAAALSALRVIRSYGGAGIPDAQVSLILRGEVIALLAVFVAVISWRFAVWIAVTGRRALLVLGVFTGIEAAAIVLGFALFRRSLGLLRTE